MEQEKVAELLTQSAKLVEKSTDLVDRVVDKVDEYNKRLSITVIVAVICMSVVILGLGWLYFRTDYDYPTIQQEQTNEQTIETDGGSK